MKARYVNINNSKRNHGSTKRQTKKSSDIRVVYDVIGIRSVRFIHCLGIDRLLRIAKVTNELNLLNNSGLDPAYRYKLPTDAVYDMTH